MTRKRYIKLLMSQHCDRNTANVTALIMRKAGISYEEAWDNYNLGSRIEQLHKVATAFEEFNNKFLTLSTNAFSNFADVINNYKNHEGNYEE